MQTVNTTSYEVPKIRTRTDVLHEKLRNFFIFLLSRDYVNKEPKACQAATTMKDLLLLRDPQRGTMPGYVRFKSYIDEWVMPAFDRYEKKQGTWALKVKDGNCPLEKAKTVDPKGGNVSWYNWLMFQNVGYWQIDPDKIPEVDSKKFYQYLECFATLTGAFTENQMKEEEKMLSLPQNSEKKEKEGQAAALKDFPTKGGVLPTLYQSEGSTVPSKKIKLEGKPQKNKKN